MWERNVQPRLTAVIGVLATATSLVYLFLMLLGVIK